MSIKPISPSFVPKLWGSTELEPWFPKQKEKIGEVWFPAGELLIKFLFTTENLSVQVHPGDEYAAQHEDSRGKTEMWHILRADPGAQVALGVREPLDPAQAAEIARSGEIMDHIVWHDAKVGDTFFAPAGTVHAIGKGLALCEIQQNSDVTYRLFDYGRERELHVQRALDVSEWVCHPGALPATELEPGVEELVSCGYFRTVRIRARQPATIPGEGYAVALEGIGSIGGIAFQPGTVWELGDSEVEIRPMDEAVLLLTGPTRA